MLLVVHFKYFTYTTSMATKAAWPLTLVEYRRRKGRYLRLEGLQVEMSHTNLRFNSKLKPNRFHNVS